MMHRIDIKNNPIINRSTNYNKYIKEISHISILSPDEEHQLFLQWIKTKDQKIKDKICMHNLKFVISIAKRYNSTLKTYNVMTLDDLIMEGNIGLINSIDKFDPSKGFKFISFAVWHIRQSIISAIQNKMRMIRLPLNKLSALNKIFLAEIEAEQEYGYSVTDIQLIDKCQQKNIKLDEIEQYFNHWKNGQRSIDMLYDSTDNKEISIELKSHEPSPDFKITEKSTDLEISQIFEKVGISKQTQEFIIDKYGLDGNKPMTWRNIGLKHHLLPQTVQNRTQRALNMLKKYNRLNNNYLLNELI